MSKVYDLTQIFNELDLLEIRLNILDPYVDFFVIGECGLTFQGKPKPLYYEENRERFSKWKDKIIHVVIPPQDIKNSFEMAAYQKDYLRTALKDCKPDDIIYYGDVDEIWKPNLLYGIPVYISGISKLRQLNYSYWLNNRSSEDWQGTNVCMYKDLINLNELRANHDNVIDNGGWHFTNIGGMEQILKKLESYDHAEYNTDEVKSRIAERIENGEDYVGRKFDWQGNPFHFWLSEVDLPQFILDNKTKYAHLFKS